MTHFGAGLDLLLDARLLHRPMSGMERVQKNLLSALSRHPRVARLRAFVEAGDERWRDALPGGIDAIPVATVWDGLSVLLGDDAPEVYHLTWFPDRRPADVLLVAAARAAVVSAADAILHRHPEYFPSPEAHAAHVRFTGRLVRLADRVVSYTEAGRRDAIEEIGAEARRCEVVSHGIDPIFREPLGAEERRARLRALGAPDDFLLVLGKDYPHKDLLCAFEALALRPEAPPLLVAGARVWPGPVRDGRTLEEHRRRLRLKERVRFVDAPADRDVLALLSAARALVFPSREEGFGLPPIEAAFVGTPVVAARADAVVEVMGEDALFFPKGDASALAERLDEVLAGGAALAALVERARRRAEGFTWERVASQLVAVYERALEARRRRSDDERLREALAFLAAEPGVERDGAGLWKPRREGVSGHARAPEPSRREPEARVPRWSLRRRLRKIARRLGLSPSPEARRRSASPPRRDRG